MYIICTGLLSYFHTFASAIVKWMFSCILCVIKNILNDHGALCKTLQGYSLRHLKFESIFDIAL